MRRALPTPLLLALALVVAGQAGAQSASAPAAESEKTAPVSSAAPSSPPRAVSLATAAKLAAIAPKFIPPKPASAATAEAPPAAIEPDKPRNTIIRLPSYIVREPKVREFKQRELLTPQGSIDLAYKKFPGLRFGSLPFFSNNGIGLFMLEEENRLERMREMEDLLSLLRYTNDDPKGETATKARQTFIRHD